MEGLAPAGHSGVQKGQHVSPSGNRTPVSRVTGGDTHHYTNEDDTRHAHTHSGPSTTPGNNHSVRLAQRPLLAPHCSATQKITKPGVNTRTPKRNPGGPPRPWTPVPAGLETRPLSHGCGVRVVVGNTHPVRTRFVRHTRAALRAVGTDRGLQGGDPDPHLEALRRLAASGRRCSGKGKFGGRGPQLEHPDAARCGQTRAWHGAPSHQEGLCAPGRRSPARRAAWGPDLLSGWPSGLRRCVQVAVSPGGVGSNPTPDKFAF